MSRTVAELVHKLTSTGSAINSSRSLALKAMAEATKTSVLNEARHIAPDLNLSGVGRNGARINARYTIGVSAAEVKATGPWQLIENDAKPHVIASRGLRGTRKSRAAKVNAGDRLQMRGGADTTRLAINGSYRFYVQHPGTKGQHPWRNGINQIQPKLPAIAANVYRQQIYRIFR